MHTFFRRRTMTPGRHFARGAGIALLIIAALIAFSALTQLLWNAVIPPVIGWKSLTFFQAMGLLVLAKILIGFGGPRHRQAFGPWGRPGWGREEWRNYHNFWKEEGEQAFKAYLERQKSEPRE